MPHCARISAEDPPPDLTAGARLSMPGRCHPGFTKRTHEPWTLDTESDAGMRPRHRQRIPLALSELSGFCEIPFR